ncbi:ABC transporter ATP-binding protein [Halorubrum trueperi]|uniref:ABC transporter ATP-binding protein n=1 Tax=Halorubrum trueperi TaxID=2004704 RepID=A0ABD5UN97_9EURY
MALLELNDLNIEYKTDQGNVRAVEDVNIQIEKGETVGIVGESGCGKTTMAKSVLGILPSNANIVSGEIIYDGKDLTERSEDFLRENIRWSEISWIAQNAMNALNPVYRIKSLFHEALSIHTDLSKAERREKIEQLLTDVDLDAAVINDYGHELSGGQRQRVIIALALALSPPLIIADEPTTGLDVVIQDQILRLISDLQKETNSAMMFISHDVNAVAEVSDKTSVMYAGNVVESGDSSDVFKSPAHPYTVGLMNAFPRIDSDPDDALVTIPGSPPELIDPPKGCRFKSRCPFATEDCTVTPPDTKVNNRSHVAKCHYTSKAEKFREEGKKIETWEQNDTVEVR